MREGIKNNFKKTLHELYFNIENKICSYQLILLIIKHFYKKSGKYSDLNISDLKNKLTQLYLNNNYLESLIHILHKNNKKEIMTKLLVNADGSSKQTIRLDTLIASDDYYLTYIDLYLLSKEYDLPIILLCNTIIDLSITDENFIILNVNKKNDDYYFLKVPSKYSREKIQNYKLLHFKDSLIVNLNNDVINSKNYSLATKILSNLKLYIDILNEYIIKYDYKKATKSKYVKIQKDVKIKEPAKMEPTEEKKPSTEKVKKEKKEKLPRCPNKQRRNKITGECEEIKK